jgi:hypothetical protein
MERLQAAARAVEIRVGGTAQLAGVTAAGTALPGQRAVIVSRQPGYSISNHVKFVGQTTACLVPHQAVSMSHESDLSRQCFITSEYKSNPIAVVVCGDTSPGHYLKHLQHDLITRRSLSSEQHMVLLQYSAAVSLGNFLQQQPALYKLAVRVVKKWVLQSLKDFPLCW